MLDISALGSYDFKVDGFLSQGILTNSGWPESVKELSRICIVTNQISLRILQNSSVSAGLRGYLSLALLGQATTSFEACCILAGLGMEGESRVQARGCIEAGVWGCVHSADPEFSLANFLDGDRKEHYSKLDATLLSGDYNDIGAYAVHIRDVISEMREIRGVRTNLRDMALKGGVIFEYDLIYRFLSREGGHVTWDSLEKVTLQGESRELNGVCIRPRFERLGETLMIAAYCQLVALYGFQRAVPDSITVEALTMLRDEVVRLGQLPQ